MVQVIGLRVTHDVEPVRAALGCARIPRCHNLKATAEELLDIEGPLDLHLRALLLLVQLANTAEPVDPTHILTCALLEGHSKVGADA